MINRHSLVLVSHTPSGLEVVPTIAVDFSIFKRVSHIHVQTTTALHKNSKLSSLRNTINKQTGETCNSTHNTFVLKSLCHVALSSLAAQFLIYFARLTVRLIVHKNFL